MTALYIILAVILFFVLVFSVKISAELIYDTDFKVTLKILFLKIPLLPSKEKKEKKPKKEKPKKEKPKEEPPGEQPAAENAPKKENFVMKFYHDQGFDGTVTFIKDVLGILNTFLGDLFRR